MGACVRVPVFLRLFWNEVVIWFAGFEVRMGKFQSFW